MGEGWRWSFPLLLNTVSFAGSDVSMVWGGDEIPLTPLLLPSVAGVAAALGHRG